MQIENVSGQPLVIAATDQLVEPGDTVEVDSDLGKQLREQPDNWAAPKKSASGGKSKED